MLEEWGLPVAAVNSACRGAGEVDEAFVRLEGSRGSLPWDIDGIVVKLDRFDQAAGMGSVSRAPRWAVAWKFHTPEVATRLVRIEFGVGRTGRLTPVAKLEPVRVGGVTVSSATLHNEDEMLRKDVRPGDMVIVRRAGEVIPEIVRSLGTGSGERGDPVSFPASCPVCGGPVERPEGESAHRCMNFSCPARLRESILHWTGRDALDIEGLGGKLADRLVETGMVRDLSDLYRITAASLSGLERMGDRSASKLVSEIDGSRTPPLERFITGLGVPGVGRVVARALAGRFGSIEAIAAARVQDLMSVPGIGPVLADSLVRFFDDPVTSGALMRLIDAGVAPRQEAMERSNVLGGQTIVFTGSLSMPRDEARRLAESLGAKVTDSVTSRTTLVVAGPGAGTKLGKARSQGIEIIDESEFMKRYGA